LFSSPREKTLKSGKDMVRTTLRMTFRMTKGKTEKRKVMIRMTFRMTKHDVKILFIVRKWDKKIRKNGKISAFSRVK
jgi:hypothetical protein